MCNVQCAVCGSSLQCLNENMQCSVYCMKCAVYFFSVQWAVYCLVYTASDLDQLPGAKASSTVLYYSIYLAFNQLDRTALLYSTSVLCQDVYLINRPGVAGAFLQSPPSFINSLINSLTDGLWKYIPNTVNPKPEELGS